MLSDLRYAARTLAKSPAFSAVAILSLALGIGASTALFSLMDVMLLRALPVKNPQQLVEFARAAPDAIMTNLPSPVFEYVRRDTSALSDVFAFTSSNLRAAGMAEPARVHDVSGSFFPALGVPPLMGRTIAPEDDRAAAPNRVAVISYSFWSRQFGRDPSALGAVVRLSGERFTITGIMPPEFVGVDRGAVPDLWVPLAADADPGQLWVLGRLRSGVSVARARAQLEPLFLQAMQSLRDSSVLSQRLVLNRATEGTSRLRWSYWEYSSTLKILIGLTGLVLLIACANLANLLMARSAARSREIGIRLALGAGRWRLVRQLMTENFLLSFAGGALGVLVAGGGHRLLLGFLVRDPLTVALDGRLDYRLLGFGFALSIATGLLFGLMPALRATAGHQRGAWNTPLAKSLLAVQIGLSMVLLIGAGLFARSLRNLNVADLGLARENLLLVNVRAAAKTPQARQQFWRQLTDRMSGLPGVRNVSLAGDAVFGNGGWNQDVWIERPGQPAENAKVSDNLVGPGFFATSGIPVLTGREFGAQDRENTALVALVNQTFARRAFGSGNPIGKRFGDRGLGSAGRYEIVGVVGDAKYGNVREQIRPMVFHPILQEPARASCVMHLRTASEPGALVPAIRREIQATDGDALIGEIRTVPQVLRGQLRQDRMFALLAGFFALLALALGGIGIYGILAYRVARRTAEIGIRVALGAQQRDVLWLILRETLILLTAGAAVGVPAALAAARLIRSLLFGLSPWDPLTVACATIILFAAGALAGFLPARRAASIEPTVALRSE
ncbi:putative Permease [Candidatus Sulfopaludibacter sp. SbA3]|nr:putative Permease [Candidatus Sulfopaludibacter sp. SbA3]